jgi:hypothetical protein
MLVLLDTCYVPAQPEESASYRLLGLLIVVTVMVAPWMLALMLVIRAPAAIFLGLVFAAFSGVMLGAIMADR